MKKPPTWGDRSLKVLARAVWMASSLARLLAERLADSAGSARVAAAGRQHVHAAFDRERMRQQYLALLEHPPG